ncbi:MAG: hypothetical protein K6F11_01665 [Lachnospiraceae bacterium]|nr:hypothetical protein [Lachnospiraceae bacterium]
MKLLLSCGCLETVVSPFADSFSDYINLISFNLFLTLIIEVPVAFLLGVRKRKDVETVVFTNAVSNPAVVTVFWILLRCHIISGIWNIWVLLLEIAAVLGEGSVYRRFLPKGRLNPFLLSFLANLVSFAVGAVL